MRSSPSLARRCGHLTWTGLMIGVCLMTLFNLVCCTVRNFRVGKDEDAKLRCMPNGTKPMHPHWVVWHKGPQPFDKLGHRFYFDPETGTLTIANIKIEDDGNYTCSAGWGPRFEPITVTVHVTVFPRISMTSADPMKPHVGQNVTLTCKAPGRPVPTIHWYSNKQEQIHKTEKDVSRVFVYERLVEHGEITALVSYLVIAPVCAKDRGRFVCVATNVVGSAQGGVDVGVQWSPVMLAPLQDIFVYWWEGHKVNLTCQSAGNPAPVLIWTSFDETGSSHPMPLAPFVKITNGDVVTSSIWLPLEEMVLPAVFKCRAENMHGVSIERRFDVRQGYRPLPPVVHILSIKEDELVLSVNIPFSEDTPPVVYVTAHYRLEESYREMDASTSFTGNGTRLLLRGIMLYYKYVIKVRVANRVGESNDTVLNILSEEKTFTPSTSTLPIVTAEIQRNKDAGPNSQTNASFTKSSRNETKTNDDDNYHDDDIDNVKTLRSLEKGYNSACLSPQSFVLTVISLLLVMVVKNDFNITTEDK